MVISRDQNAGRIQSVWIDNSTFERVEEFKYLGTTLAFCRRNYFFNFSTPVYKMWIIQEPNMLELWNKLHFEEEEKKMESIHYV